MNVAIVLAMAIVTLIECNAAQGDLDGDVRLVDGRTNTSGRVEIYYRGRWGTICDDYFGHNDANVICNQLGFGDMKSQRLPHTPPGRGRVLLDNLNCNGDEFFVSECRHPGWGIENCGHFEDIGLECDGESFADDIRLNGSSSRDGRLEVRYAGKWEIVCGSSFGLSDARVACRTMGFGSNGAILSIKNVRPQSTFLRNVVCQGHESLLSECDFRGPFFLSCSFHVFLQCAGDITIDTIQFAKARLTGGSATSGRLELYLNGVWGTVCRHHFGNAEAQAACRMLNLPSTNAQSYQFSVMGQRLGPMPILLDEVQCSGTESSLLTCGHNGLAQHNCSSRDDVGVFCPGMQTSLARLTGGSATSGRLELHLMGDWGSVCSERFGKAEAQVACRMLNLPSVYAMPYRFSATHTSLYPLPILLGDVRCNDTENSLLACGHGGLGPHNCQSGGAVGVYCPDATNNTIARLAGGSATSGRLEIYLNGIWGTVCRDHFGKAEAQTACRMLNLPSLYATFYQFSVTRTSLGPLPILLDDVQCNGTEGSLLECGHSGLRQHDCQSRDDIGVYCTDDAHALHHHEIRLMGSSSTDRGRVEVHYVGIWGTVCDPMQRQTNTKKICQTLNLPYENARRAPIEDYGRGTGAIWLYDLRCIGTELSVFDCQHAQLGQRDRFACGHGQDVAVICEW